jgi:hypothetical protein
MTHLRGASRRPPRRPRMNGQRHRLSSAGCPGLSLQRLQNSRSHTCAQASVVFSDLRDEARVVLGWLSRDHCQTGMSSPLPCLDSIQRQVVMGLAQQMMCISQTDMNGHMNGAYQLISSPKRVITRAYAGASESIDPWACSVGSPFSRIMLSGRPHATLNCAAMILPLSGDVLAAQSPVRDSHVLSIKSQNRAGTLSRKKSVISHMPVEMRRHDASPVWQKFQALDRRQAPRLPRSLSPISCQDRCMGQEESDGNSHLWHHPGVRPGLTPAQVAPSAARLQNR